MRRSSIRFIVKSILGRKANEKKASGSASASGNVIRRSMLDDEGERLARVRVAHRSKAGIRPDPFSGYPCSHGRGGLLGRGPTRAEPKTATVSTGRAGGARHGSQDFRYVPGKNRGADAAHADARSVPRIPAPGTIIDFKIDVSGGESTFSPRRAGPSPAPRSLFLSRNGDVAFASEPVPGFRMEAIVNGGDRGGTPERDRLMWVVVKHRFSCFPVRPGDRGCQIF